MKIRKNIIWCVTWIVLLLQLDILGGVIPFLDDSIAWKIEMLLVLFDSIYLLKYLLFIFVVLIHNPLPENLWGGMDSDCSLCSSYLFCYFRLFQQGSRKKAA